MIHDHSRKYLYQLSFTCKKKPIGKKQHLYERKSHQTKMADFILQGVSGKMYAFLVPPKEPFLKTIQHPWTKIILSRGGRRKLFNQGLMNKLIRME